MFKQCNNREVRIKVVLQAMVHFQHHEGLTTEIEEILLDANAVEIEQIAPDCGDGELCIGLGWNKVLIGGCSQGKSAIGSNRHRQRSLQVRHWLIQPYW